MCHLSLRTKHSVPFTFVKTIIMAHFLLTYVECQSSESQHRRFGSRLKFSHKKFRDVRVLISGSLAEFNCKAFGNPRPSVSWYKDSLPLKFRSFKDYDIKRWELRVRNVVPEDEGNYTCVVSNKFGNISRTFYLKVLSRVFAMPPKVKDEYPKNQTSLIGSEVELKCEFDYVDDSNPPLITWMRMLMVNGSYRDENDKPYKQTLQRCSLGGFCYWTLEDTASYYNVDDPLTYVLHEATVDMTGWYGCLVENELGSDADFAYIEIIPNDPNNSTHAANIAIGFAILVIFVCLFAICIGSVFKIKQERKKTGKVHEAFKTVYQWTKVVLVEQQKFERDSQRPLLDPKITIEKRKMPAKCFELPETEYEIVFSNNDGWEINRDCVNFDGLVGEGEFGRVVRGVINVQSGVIKRTDFSVKTPTYVAVKMLKQGHSDDDLIDLLKEMEILKIIGHHEHIVNLLGVCTQPSGTPLYLITEFAENGNLKHFLLKFRPENLSRKSLDEGPYAVPDCDLMGLPLKDMYRLAYEVASGMLYLSERGCIHRDLAARNILVTAEKHAKIADFGLARDLQSKSYYRKTGSSRLPLKWMAPESVFDRISTTMSDVWSYGILLYEIVTLGEPPFKNVDAELFLSHLKEGKKMAQPRNCPDNFYYVMSKCWSVDPEARPKWRELVANMCSMYKETQPHAYIDMAPITK